MKKKRQISKNSIYLKWYISEFEYFIINDKIESKKKTVNIKLLEKNNPYKKKTNY